MEMYIKEEMYLKKLIIGISILVVVIITAYFFVPNIMMNNVKDKVMKNNTDIDKIVTINHISSWGEWFSEYVLVVTIDGQKYRIWTNNEGEITDKESLK